MSGNDEDDLGANVVQFRLPNTNDKEQIADAYSLLILFSRLKSEKRRALLMETAHRFLTMEIAEGQSASETIELAQVIVDDKLLDVFRELTGPHFHKSLKD